MAKCSIYFHPQRDAIDRALLAGEPLRALAQIHGMSHVAPFRHKQAHIPGDLARSAQLQDQERVDALVSQALARREHEQSRTLELVGKLDSAVQRLGLLIEACDHWLRDPDDLERYDVSPRAEDVSVIYREPGPDGTLVRRKARLSTLLGRVRLQRSGLEVELVESRAADPRELLLKAAHTSRTQLELLASLRGELRERPTVSMLIGSPEWMALRSRLLEALEPYPEATQAVRQALAATIAEEVTGNG